MPQDKRFVYVLKSSGDLPYFYVGLTSDVKARLIAHNAGQCPHTASRRTWQLHVVIEFSDEKRAIRFERYLKSGSGQAFASVISNRRVRPPSDDGSLASVVGANATRQHRLHAHRLASHAKVVHRSLAVNSSQAKVDLQSPSPSRAAG